MNKPPCIIGCKSNQVNLQNILRSIIKIYSGLSMSQLKLDWIFPENDSAVSLDVCIVDLDDEDHEQHLNNPDYKGYIVISKSAPLLQNYKYALNKPIHNSSLLKILRNLEQDELKSLHEESIEKTADAVVEKTSITVSETLIIDEPVYQLINWPDLTKIPDELLLNTSRVCALLSAQPSALSGVAHFLQLSHDELKNIIQQINLCAYESFPTLTQQTQNIVENTVVLPSVIEKTTANTSFLSKMWNKLKGSF